MRVRRGTRTVITPDGEVVRTLTRRAFVGRVLAAGLSVVAVLPGGRASADAATAKKRTRTLYRLSSRKQRRVCGACRANDAHRYHRSILVADGDRAHPHCRCQIVAQQVPLKTYKRYFAHHRDIFDDRWARVT
jgi:hypothetical protein